MNTHLDQCLEDRLMDSNPVLELDMPSRQLLTDSSWSFNRTRMGSRIRTLKELCMNCLEVNCDRMDHDVTLVVSHRCRVPSRYICERTR